MGIHCPTDAWVYGYSNSHHYFGCGVTVGRRGLLHQSKTVTLETGQLKLVLAWRATGFAPLLDELALGNDLGTGALDDRDEFLLFPVRYLQSVERGLQVSQDGVEFWIADLHPRM